MGAGVDRERRRRELDQRLDALFDFVPADGNDPTLDPYDDEADAEDPIGGDAGAIEVAMVELDEDDAARRGEDLVEDHAPRRAQAPVGAATALPSPHAVISLL